MVGGPAVAVRSFSVFMIHDFLRHVNDGCCSSKVADRIDRRAVDTDFVMAMRAGRVAGAAHVGDDLAAADVLAWHDDDLHGVAVARHDAVSVVDVDHVAVAA